MSTWWIWSLVYFHSFEVQIFSGLQFYTLRKTLIAFRTMQLRFVLSEKLLSNAFIGAHGKQGIDSCRYPITTPGSRETTVSKMPCLGACVPGGTRTTNPPITSQECEPLHHGTLMNPGFYSNIYMSKSDEIDILCKYVRSRSSPFIYSLFYP